MRILVADDEKEIARALKEVLEKNRYTVDTVDNGEDAYAMALSGGYDCLILDIMMPGKDGLQVISELRKSGIGTPTLLLTALGSLNDRVAGLDSGADDYLSKPFAVTELLARVRALLRRNDTYMSDIISVGNLSLNCGTYELYTPNHLTKMSNKEFQLLEFFMRNPRTVFSTETLMERFWNWDSNAEINVVWTNIGYLRKKLEELEANVHIRSIRGAGYQLEEKPCSKN